MTLRHRCVGAEATQRIGLELGRATMAGDVVGLVGDLGAGKTHFVQGVARGLEVPTETRVTSPTFTLVNEYRGGRLTLFHADLYRIEQARELDEIGLDEAFEAGGVAAVEWCDRYDVLPPDHLLVRFEITGADERWLDITATGPRSVELAARLATRL